MISHVTGIFHQVSYGPVALLFDNRLMCSGLSVFEGQQRVEIGSTACPRP